MTDLKLSPAHQDVVNFSDGALLVLAGAGSGKTRVLTERIKKLATSANTSNGILALTFTNKAAKEMAERLDGVIKSPQQNIYIGTIHGFCLSILSIRSHMLGYDVPPLIFNSSDCEALIDEIILANSHVQNLILSDPKFPTFLREYISESKRNLRVPDVSLNPSSFEEQLYLEYTNRLREMNVIDFDDVIFLTFDLFNKYPNVAALYEEAYKYVCVDEAQDLTLAHYSIIKALCKNIGNLMMVGDPRQTIFSFTGSSSKYLTDHFVSDFTPNKIELNENFRSAKSIVALAQKIDPSYSINGNITLEGEVQIRPFTNETSEAEWIVKQLLHLYHNGHPDLESPINWGNFAILSRTRYVTKNIEKEFQNHKIPFYKQSETTNESESSFFRCFELGLKVLINPSDRLHYNQIVTLLNKIDSTTAAPPRYSLNLFDYVSCFPSIGPVLVNSWKKLSLDNPDFLSSLTEIRSFLESRTISDEECELLHNDLNLWEQLWKNYQNSTVYGKRSLASFLNSNSLGLTRQIQNRDHHVAVLTVHAAKGLERDVIFVIGLCQGVFPDFRSIDQKTGEPAQDEKNNFLVAVTRAKRLLYLTHPQNRLMSWGDIKSQTPSIFLKLLE